VANRVQTGQRLGNYYLIQCLGAGGFAEVYLGEHIHLKNRAAIKVLRTALSQTEEGDIRKEALLLAQLDHPHIVRLRDFAIDGTTPYLVMDYASGGTLREQHPEGTQLSCDQVVDYVWQIADALQYAHDQHIIHRDIKPENLLLNRRGEVLVSDFGIAHLTQSFHLTRDSVAGTTYYMAPEQIQGTPRRSSDQYALAVVVYEWLTGTRPFLGDPQAVLSKHLLADPPPLRSVVPHLSPAVEAVVLAALAKAPEHRYPSILAFAQALEQASQVATSEPVVASLLPDDLAMLYKQGVAAKVRGDLEEAERLWSQVVERAPFFRDGIAAEQLEEIRQQLFPIRINQWKETAEEARNEGNWEQEIKAWQQVLQLNPRLREARTYLRHAQRHLRYAQLYQDAVQFVQERQDDAARELLQRIWSEDPYYGDSAGLARILKLRVPRSYQEERRQEEQKRQRGNLLYLAYGPDFGGSRMGANVAWCSTIGAGLCTVGITQSWLLALFALGMMALAGWGMGYRRVMLPRVFVGQLLANALVVSIVALLLSFVSYQQPYTGSFLKTIYTNPEAQPTIQHATWHIWPQSQVICGILFGLAIPGILALLICYLYPPLSLGKKQAPNSYASWSFFWRCMWIITAGCLFVLTVALSQTQSNVGYGFDAGFPLVLLGLISGLLLGSGLAGSLPLWFTILRLWLERGD
jgi:tetratricopeptide (TPR) repeat protein